MMDMPHKMPKPPMEMHMDMKGPSPLEQALSNKSKMNTIRQKYNLKNPKEMKMPKMIYEGENRS